MSDGWGDEKACSRCGHPASYHGVTFCQVAAGSDAKRRCDCRGWATLAAIEAEAATSPALDPIKCGICGDYSAQGVEVHEACLTLLSSFQPHPATPPALDRDALRTVLSDLYDRSTPMHSSLCAGQDDEAECVCGTAAVMDRVLAALSTGDKT